MTTVALAGCLGSLPLGGSGSSESAAADWMAESVFDAGTLTRVERPAQLAAVEGLDYASVVEELPGIDYEEVDLQVIDRNAPSVLLGSFEAESMVDAFGEAIGTDEPQADGTYGGYDVYTGGQSLAIYTGGLPLGGEAEPTLGVDGGTAVIANAREGVEDTIDANRGEGARLVDTDSQFEQLQGSFEGAEFYQLLRPESDSDVLLGLEATLDSNETEVQVAVDHPNTTGAEMFGEDAPDLLSGTGLNNTDIEVDGEQVRVTGTRQTDEIEMVGLVGLVNTLRPVFQYFNRAVSDGGGSGPAPPQVAFDYDYSESEETLRVTVQSGDTFTAGQVQFSVSGLDETGVSWAEIAGEEVTPESTVGAGNQVTLTGVRSNFELGIIWEPSDGGDSVIISSQTGPDA
ncbi:MAG: hypothetical protein J07HX64_02936 [halophilic archaeon J07HX64]|jgi:hypothetical protein|nr:MAG: hypothetical protein J07HX64_02936 [halophilic archaeon J07HX64]